MDQTANTSWKLAAMPLWFLHWYRARVIILNIFNAYADHRNARHLIHEKEPTARQPQHNKEL